MNKLPPRHRFIVNHNNTEKYRVCQQRFTQQSPDTRDWLTIQNRASHDLSKYAVFYAILDKEKDVVVKVGPDVLKTEYAIGKELETLGLPTFINYYCVFDCLDDKDMLFNKKKIPEFFCKQDAAYRMHALVMPTIKGEPIENIKWSRKSFSQFKTILKHVVMSLFYAMNDCGFIHGDLHTGNILIEKTQTDIEINYGDFGSQETNGYLPIIMDYDMSKINVKSDELKSFLYKDLRTYIYNACAGLNDMRIDDVTITTLLAQLMKDCEPPTPSICNQICNSIDDLKIKFIISELQKPNFRIFGGAKTRRVKK